MNLSSIGNRVRQWVQWYVGVLSLESAQKRRHDELCGRHIETLQGIADIMKVLHDNNLSIGVSFAVVDQRIAACEKELSDNLTSFRATRNAQHDEVLSNIGLISERLGRLENMFVSQHVPARPQAAVYDWEQVQAMALADMLKDGSPKEDLD